MVRVTWLGYPCNPNPNHKGAHHLILNLTIKLILALLSDIKSNLKDGLGLFKVRVKITQGYG